ncbi:A-kinase anchor protein SPHKAP [Crotalus adamanteus]|uniref:A-kinase anchor protein SPHKAP n=1 Tax=Crotalus adamanteus TaxID=8729 RepID=A0AAW1BFZ0_CROAD
MCFVNLDAGKADYNSEFMKQKLVNISPNLPKFIASMNVQPPKDNEIIFLSGLTSENLQADFEVSQCSWLADVCLLQCARGNRRKNTSCIIFEINKFLIGLELMQKKQLHVEAGNLKPEDDTNCSVSSIEEDFLTASEHFEDEDDEYKQGDENLHLAAEFKKEVPLIQIETDQRQDLDNASEPLNGVNVTSGEKRDLLKIKPIDADSGQQLISSKSHGLTVGSCPESEASVNNTAVEEFPIPLSSSEESTCSSWCQLANNPDDTSSYLQLSERSMSNGNSSTSSSLGIMDLEIYQENIPSSPAFK